MTKIKQFLFLATISIFSITNTIAALVGIIGDVHGEKEYLKQSMLQMKERNVEYLIGLGDYIGRNIRSHYEIFNCFHFSGIQKENIYLFPGNWDHQNGPSASKVNLIFREFGILVEDEFAKLNIYSETRDEGLGYIQIEGRNIMVSHFPQHRVEDKYLQPKAFRARQKYHRKKDFGPENEWKEFMGQPWQELTMEREIYPKEGTDLELFAHTHKRTYFMLPNGIPVFNVGSFARIRNNLERSYGIYDTDKNIFYFIDVDLNEIIGDPIPLSNEQNFNKYDAATSKV